MSATFEKKAGNNTPTKAQAQAQAQTQTQTQACMHTHRHTQAHTHNETNTHTHAHIMRQTYPGSETETRRVGKTAIVSSTLAAMKPCCCKKCSWISASTICIRIAA